ncbi:unnamed protein product, partial [Polarella glacialis]
AHKKLEERAAKPAAKVAPPSSGGTLLARKEASKQPKGPLTKFQRQARNKKISEVIRDEQLRKQFGESRDWVPKRRKKSLQDWLPEEYQQDTQEVVPTRRKVSKVDDN